jgi:cytochrome b subunit of formate dehydrogenase
MSENTQYQRFDKARRLEHLLLIISFTTLGVTGLAQKYATVGVSDFIIQVLGGIEFTRIIHRTAAAIFLLESVYHLVVLGYKLYVRRVEASMMPGLKDARDAIQFMGYNLGLTKDHPKMGRYNFAEKMEYLAMVWGLVLMGLTGLMLWNPITTANLLPGQFIPAAKSAHGNEAVLAVLAIILWHFYNVHIKKWNWSMIRGTMSRAEMQEEHALELAAIEAGKHAPVVTPEVRKKRLSIYMPVAAIVTVVLAVIIFQFLTFEKTAITTTVPPALGNVPVFQRQTPTSLPTIAPTAVPQPTSTPNGTRWVEATATPASGGGSTGGALTWNGSVGKIIQDNCGTCHGAAATAGLNVTTYAGLMKGGNSGPAVIAGDPDNSLLIKKVKAGHPKVFSDADLATVMSWIKAGAPEK